MICPIFPMCYESDYICGMSNISKQTMICPICLMCYESDYICAMSNISKQIMICPICRMCYGSEILFKFQSMKSQWNIASYVMSLICKPMLPSSFHQCKKLYYTTTNQATIKVMIPFCHKMSCLIRPKTYMSQGTIVSWWYNAKNLSDGKRTWPTSPEISDTIIFCIIYWILMLSSFPCSIHAGLLPLNLLNCGPKTTSPSTLHRWS
jgi:hypothetical protein